MGAVNSLSNKEAQGQGEKWLAQGPTERPVGEQERYGHLSLLPATRREYHIFKTSLVEARL